MKTAEELNSGWRKVTSTIYKRPIDSKIFGSVEIDITDLKEYISEKRKTVLKPRLHMCLYLLLPER